MKPHSLILAGVAMATLATSVLAAANDEAAAQAAPPAASGVTTPPPATIPAAAGAPASAEPPASGDTKAAPASETTKRVQYPGFAVTERYDSSGSVWKSVDWSDGGGAKGAHRSAAGHSKSAKPAKPK